MEVSRTGQPAVEVAIDYNIVKSLEKRVDTLKFQRREEGLYYDSFEYINRIYEAIVDDRVEDIPSILGEMTQSGASAGTVSRNPVRNMKTLMIVFLTGIITRLLNERRIDIKDEAPIADVYTMAIEEAQDIPQIIHLTLAATAVIAKAVSKKTHADYHPLIKSTMQYVKRNLHGRIQIGEIAEQNGVSASYLSQVFKRGTGETITAFILEQKIEESKRLLETTDFSVSEISQYLGFATPSHFGREFSKVTHITPTQYRRSHATRFEMNES